MYCSCLLGSTSTLLAAYDYIMSLNYQNMSILVEHCLTKEASNKASSLEESHVTQTTYQFLSHVVNMPKSQGASQTEEYRHKVCPSFNIIQIKICAGDWGTLQRRAPVACTDLNLFYSIPYNNNWFTCSYLSHFDPVSAFTALRKSRSGLPETLRPKLAIWGTDGDLINGLTKNKIRWS